METEWIVIIIMSYILVGMFLADTFVPLTYDFSWFTIVIFWLPIIMILFILFTLLALTVTVYKLFR